MHLGTKNRIKEMELNFLRKCKKPIVIRKLFILFTCSTLISIFLSAIPKPAPVVRPNGGALPPPYSRSRNFYTPKFLSLQLDTDKNPLTSSRFQILSIPTIILFDEGKEVKRMTGALNLQQLEVLLKPWITIN
jgi:hypothetical protein